MTGSSEHLSDRMPTVSRGQESWSPDDQAHLAGCEECRAEWQLHRMALAVGERVEASVDVEAIVAGVTHRLSSQGAPPLGRVGGRGGLRGTLRWMVPLAAAAALLVAVLPRLGGPALDSTGDAVAQAWLPELESLSADDLESLFEILPAADGGGRSLPSPRLGDLTADELESLLSSLEG